MSEHVGDDGLTDAERAELAERYRLGAGRKTLTAAEKQALAAWLANKE